MRDPRLLGKLDRDRRTPDDLQIVMPILPTVRVGRFRPEYRLVLGVPPMAQEAVQAAPDTTEDLLTRV